MNKKTLIILMAAAAVIAAVILISPDSRGESIPEKTVLPASNAAERIDYFASHGWDVEEISGKDIIIPSQFSTAYDEYVEIQDKQGLPLRSFAGKEAQLYVYDVKNYSPENRKMLAELIVCDNIIAASLVYSDDGGSVRMSVV